MNGPGRYWLRRCPARGCLHPVSTASEELGVSSRGDRSTEGCGEFRDQGGLLVYTDRQRCGSEQGVARRRSVEAAGTQPRGSPRVPAGGPTLPWSLHRVSRGNGSSSGDDRPQYHSWLVGAILKCGWEVQRGTLARGIVRLSLAGSRDEPAQKRRDRPREKTEFVAKSRRKCRAGSSDEVRAGGWRVPGVKALGIQYCSCSRAGRLLDANEL